MLCVFVGGLFVGRLLGHDRAKRSPMQILQVKLVETQIGPVVVRTLGIDSKQFPGYLNTIGITSYCSESELQKNALQGSAAILRKSLDFQGSWVAGGVLSVLFSSKTSRVSYDRYLK